MAGRPLRRARRDPSELSERQRALLDRLQALGAKAHAMMTDAIAHTRGYNPSQVVFFAMTSRREDARAFDASIGRSEMERAARQIGGIVKMGYIVGSTAYVLPKR
jgi:hypothetical protein